MDMLRLTLPHCRSVVALGSPETFNPDLRGALEQSGNRIQAMAPAQVPAFLGRIVKDVVKATRTPAAARQKAPKAVAQTTNA